MEDVVVTAETLIHTILGPTRVKTRTIILAIEIVVQLLFEENRLMEDIRLSRDVYGPIAAAQKTEPETISRQVIRLSNRCWDEMTEDMKWLYIGKAPKYISPGDLLFYFAYYVYHGKSYYKVIADQEKRII